MCDVRKSVVRLIAMGLAAGMLAGALTTAKAQVSTQVNIKRRQQAHARRETNASRQARIARTIQDTYSHRFEIFGGGGYERFRPGEYLKKNNEVSWNVNTTYFFSPKLGLVGTAQGSFGTAHTYTANTLSPGLSAYVPTAQINEYYFMAGPSYRFYAKEKLALSAQAQGGIGWGIFGGGSKGYLPTEVGIWSDATRPAFSLGISADYNLYPNLALRLTPQYIGTTFGGYVQNNMGFNAGIVYRFGRQ
jgi:hypothetical protein